MPAYSLIYTISDGKAKGGFTEVKIPDSFTLAQITTFAVNMGQAIDAMITGKIDRVGLAVTIPLSLITGIKTSAGANSDVEERGYFQFVTENGFYTAMSIPTFDESLIVAGSNAIDVDDATVATFIAAMIDGVDLDGAGSGTVIIEPTDIRGEDIVALSIAKEQFKSS